MSPAERVTVLRTEARAELASHLRVAAQKGGDYIDAYVESIVYGHHPPARPGDLHSEAAKMCREITLDVAAGMRL